MIPVILPSGRIINLALVTWVEYSSWRASNDKYADMISGLTVHFTRGGVQLSGADADALIEHLGGPRL